MVDGDHLFDREEVRSRVHQVADTDVDVKCHPQMHHILLRNGGVRYIEVG